MKPKIHRAIITNGIVSNDKLVTYEQMFRWDAEGNELVNGRHGIAVNAGFKAIEVTLAQYEKLLSYTTHDKHDEEGYFTCTTAADYIKFVLLSNEMYGYDVLSYQVTTLPTPETKGWLSLKILHRDSFGNQAQKKLFQRLDNLANVFESVHKRHENKLLRHQVAGKWHYRQPTFLTLTIPLQGKVFKRVKVLPDETAEVEDRSKKNLQEFYRWVRWKYFPDIGEKLQIIQAHLQPCKVVEQSGETTHHEQRTTNATHEIFIRCGLTDKFIKENLLDHLLQNLRKTYGLVAYVWKAEAQLRGEIHFHLVLDCYIPRDACIRLWWGYVRQYGLHKDEHNESNINLWIESRPNPASLKAEMAGYFAHQLDNHGNVKYKHNKRRTVRAIEGSAWGCSDNLRYEPLTLTDLSNSDIEMIEENCVKYKPVHARNKDKSTKLDWHGNPMVLARVFITRHSEKVADKVPGEKPAQYRTDEKHYAPIREKLYDYHLSQAIKIYGNEN